MALSLNAPSSGAMRISQILPMIKCSRCGEETDINFADQHVCKPASQSTTPAAPAKAPEPQRPVSRSTDRASTVSSISVPSVSSYSSRSRSSTSTKRAPSIRSTHTIQQSPPPDIPSRPQYKSTASSVSYKSYQSRSSVDDGTRRGSPPPRSGPSPTPTARSGPSPSPILRSSPSPIPRSGPSPSPTARSGPSPVPPRSGPSPTPSSRTIPRTTPSPAPTIPRTTPSPAPTIPTSRTPEPPAAPLPAIAPLVPRKLSRSGSGPLPPQPPPPTHAPPPPDTKSGGEAGMAGVGRRGFAAAAQAALFAQGNHKFGLPSPGLSPTSIYGYPGSMPRFEPGQILTPTSPLDGRATSPAGSFLNISTDVNGATPPLSPSYSPASPSPMSRPQSPADNARSPGAEIARANSRSPSPVDVIDGSGPRSLAKGKGVVGGLASLTTLVNKLGQADSAPALSTVAAGKQPLRTTSPEPMDDSAPEQADRGRSRATRSRAASSDAESDTELAYGSWRSPSPPANRSRKASLASLNIAKEGDDTTNEANTIAFPRRGSNGSDHVPKRTGSQSSGYSSSSGSASGSQSGARRVKQSAGAQTLSALREEDEDDVRSTYTTPSSAEIDGTFKVTSAPNRVEEPVLAAVTAKTLDTLGSDMDTLGFDGDRLNLPTRAKTSASASSGSSSGTRRRRIRTCAKCEKRIEDGRWIKIDDGSGGNTVLCEADWKMLYLPKCRQCGLAIETQAIYASDGQLKGKYHKECFNCYSCHQPFPDRSFYVHQEKPYCKYHYHEANNSLCASPSCREPIEGPCAVSHSGTRYHPEHFTCDYEDLDGKCSTLLNEYWEIDGERMCDRHARRTVNAALRNVPEGSMEVKARKRQTVFMDLGTQNGTGNGR